MVVKKRAEIWVTADFVAFHRWKSAPDFVSYLRQYHRHLFKVKLTIPVTGLDRDYEFFTLKDELYGFIEAKYAERSFDFSCEQFAFKIASFILDEHKLLSYVAVEVSEDGENGAEVFLERGADI